MTQRLMMFPQCPPRKFQSCWKLFFCKYDWVSPHENSVSPETIFLYGRRSLIVGENTVLCMGIQSLVAGLYVHIEQTSLAMTCASCQDQAWPRRQILRGLIFGEAEDIPKYVLLFLFYNCALASCEGRAMRVVRHDVRRF